MQDPAATSPGEVPFREQALNRSTQGSWSDYGEHRRHMMELVLDAAKATESATPSICILGAGNLNDLDLLKLLKRFPTITLIDLDRQAVVAGVARQLETIDAPDEREVFEQRIRIIAPVDLSVVAPLLRPNLHENLEGEQLTVHAQEVTRRLASFSSFLQGVGDSESETNLGATWYEELGPFDVVASTCMLSQLVRQMNDALGEKASRAALDHMTIQVHLELLAALTKPNGQMLLFTDLAGTSTGVPELATVGQVSELAVLAERFISEGRHFAYLAPAELVSLAKSGRVRRYVTSISASPYWLWKIGEGKVYLCYALLLGRSSILREAKLTSAEDRLAAKLNEFSVRTGVLVSDLGKLKK